MTGNVSDDKLSGLLVDMLLIGLLVYIIHQDSTTKNYHNLGMLQRY